jgi:hypothetical protein
MAKLDSKMLAILGTIFLVIGLAIYIPNMLDDEDQTDDDPDDGDQDPTVSPEISVYYEGSEIEDGTSNLNLGSVNRLANNDFVFTINNTGTGSLLLNNPTNYVEITGSGFILFSDAADSVIEPDSSTTFTIRFVHARHGHFTGQLYITNNDTDESMYNFSFSIDVIYSYNHNIDGANDFNSTNSAIQSITPSYWGWVSWNETHFFYGMNGTDIGTGSSSRHLIVYLSGIGPTTDMGKDFGTQEPGLPFWATTAIDWCTDNMDTVIYEFDGTVWSEVTGTGIEIYQSGEFVEISYPLANLGLIFPSTLNFHMSMVDTSADWTWGAVPSNSFVDLGGDGGENDPNYETYYSFELGNALAPTDHTPIEPV